MPQYATSSSINSPTVFSLPTQCYSTQTSPSCRIDHPNRLDFPSADPYSPSEQPPTNRVNSSLSTRPSKFADGDCYDLSVYPTKEFRSKKPSLKLNTQPGYHKPIDSSAFNSPPPLRENDMAKGQATARPMEQSSNSKAHGGWWKFGRRNKGKGKN